MLDITPHHIAFRFEVHPGGSVDGRREIVTQDFKDRFGDIDCRIIMIHKVKEKDNGVRLYQGYAQEIT